jgi:uncharacterized protein (DUF1499 family)
MLRALRWAQGGDTVQKSRVARLAGTFGVAGLVLFVAGPAGIQLGVLDPFTGFRTFLFGSLLGLFALALGVLGLYFTRPAAYREGRGRALVGAVLGALIVGLTLAGARGGAGVPAINDITTNPDDPPTFASDPWKHGRDMRYPGASFAEQQRAGYPDLAPIVVALPPAQALARVQTLFEQYGWVVTQSDPVSNTLEGTDTSHLFRFVDDIVVRVRPHDGGSVVDVRSKSRVGRGDMGANAARIRRLREGLRAAG